MKQEQREHVEKRLLEERARVNRALERLDEAATISTVDDGELSGYPLHLADQGTDTQEQEKSLALLGKEGELLGDIDESLRRLYKEPERFGRCDSCDTEIPLERLDVVPWARTCLQCQRIQEDGSR